MEISCNINTQVPGTITVLEATSAKVLFEGSDNKDAAGYYEIRDQAGDRVEVAVRTATAPADGDVDSLEKSDIDGHWFCTVI